MKDNNFISIVAYLDKNTSVKKLEEFLSVLNKIMSTKFEHYEFIFVSMQGTDDAASCIKSFAERNNTIITLITMSMRQTHDQCMNAGVDIAIGDYVYEFDTCDLTDDALIYKAYEVSLTGFDIVTIAPEKQKATSKLFYRVFSANSHSMYKLHTDDFRLVTRRAINRLYSLHVEIPYRKAAYATSGLKTTTIFYHGKKNTVKNSFGFAINALLFYTGFGYRFSTFLTIFFAMISLGELIYTIAIWISGKPVSGWTTTMFVLTFSFLGLFAVLSIILKYLSLILKTVFRKQKYLIERVEKF